MLWDASDAEGRNALRVSAATPLQALPSTLSEGFEAGWESFLAEDQSVSKSRLETMAWHDLVGDAVEKSGERIANPGRALTGSNPIDLVGDAVSEAITGQPWALSARGRYEAVKAETRAQLQRLRDAGNDVFVPTDQDIQDRVQQIADAKRNRLGDVQAGGGWGAVGAALGGFAGAMADPPNAFSVALGAPAGIGVLRAMAVEAGINAGVEATNQVAVAEFKRELGRDYGVGAAAEAVGMAAAGAAGLTAVGHGAAAVLRRWRAAKAVKPELGDLPEARAGEVYATRAATLEETNPRPGFDGEQTHAQLLDAAEAALNGETEALRQAYREVRADPNGDPMAPLVSLTTADMQKVIVARGGFQNVNALEVSRRGWGLVKVIWGHGEGSRTPQRLQVTEDDVIALPEIVRTKTPVSGTGRDGSLTWIVEREHPEFGARRIVYGTNRTERIPDQTLVTVYVLDPKDLRRSALPNSQEIAGVRPVSPGEASNPPRDTAALSSESETQGQTGSPASSNIAKGRPDGQPLGARFSGPLSEIDREAYARSEGDGPASQNMARGTPEINRAAPDFRPLPDALRPPGGGRKPVSLVEFLRRKGGLRDEGGELAAMDLNKARPGTVSRRGLAHDMAREAAVEAGYLRPEATVRDLLDAVRKEAGGRAIYRPEDAPAVEAWSGYETATHEAADLLGGVDAARGMDDATYARAIDAARGHRAWEAGPGKDMPISDAEAAALVDAARAEGKPLDVVVGDHAEARAMWLDYAARRADEENIPFDLEPALARTETIAADDAGRWAQARDLVVEDPEGVVPWPWEGGDPNARHTFRDLFALTDEWDRDAAEALACVTLTGVAA